MYLPYYVSITLCDNFWKPDTLNAIAAIFSAGTGLLALIVSGIAVWFSFQAAKDQKDAARDQKQAAEDQKLNASAALIVELYANYKSDEIKKSRQSLSLKLLDKSNRNSIDLTKSESVLGFFEDLAYLTRRKILDRGMVWNMFFPSIEKYCTAIIADPDLFAIAAEKAKSPALYREMQTLFEELKKMDEKEEGKPAYEPLDMERVRLFLTSETELITEQK